MQYLVISGIKINSVLWYKNNLIDTAKLQFEECVIYLPIRVIKVFTHVTLNMKLNIPFLLVICLF